MCSKVKPFYSLLSTTKFSFIPEILKIVTLAQKYVEGYTLRNLKKDNNAILEREKVRYFWRGSEMTKKFLNKNARVKVLA